MHSVRFASNQAFLSSSPRFAVTRAFQMHGFSNKDLAKLKKDKHLLGSQPAEKRAAGQACGLLQTGFCRKKSKAKCVEKQQKVSENWKVQKLKRTFTGLSPNKSCAEHGSP